MALVLLGKVVTFDPALPGLDDGAVYIADGGRIEAVAAAGDPPPAGYDAAPRVPTGGVIYPGLIDLHGHLAYHWRSLWAPPGHAQPFTSRDQWPRLASYVDDIRLPTAALTQVASKPLLKYAEVKAVTGGVTAVQGSTKLSRPYEGWLVRNVEFETFGTNKKSVYQSVRTLATPDYAAAREHMTSGNAFIYHLAEGTAPALLAEYRALKQHDCLQPSLVAIHATALGQPEYLDWGPVGSSMVWSPLSNLWLYRHTSDVVAARDAGIRVCLGADWAPSGSKHALGELKVAHLWNRHPKGLGGAFDDQALCEMVTCNPADALGWGDRIGRVAAGRHADLLVLPRVLPDPYSNLVHATEAQVRLVLVGGRPLYGTPGLMHAAGAADAEAIRVAGLQRAVALVDPGVPDADMTWRQVTGALAAARRDPAAAHARLLAATPGEEPLRLIPDDPGGAPMPMMAAAELDKVTIPEIDPLDHDDAFFAALRAAPILDGLLDGLQDYYSPA